MTSSVPLPGPCGQGWDEVRPVGERWARGEVDGAVFGRACLAALTGAVRADPDAYGLRPAMLTCGTRLLRELRARPACTTGGPDIPGDPADGGADRSGEHVDLVRVFADRVADRVTGAATSAARRAAADCAEGLFGRPAVPAGPPDPPRSAPDGWLPVADRLYRRFLGRCVAEFLGTACAARLLLAAPLPQMAPFTALDDLTDELTDRVAARVPTPPGPTPAEVARSVAAALGLAP